MKNERLTKVFKDCARRYSLIFALYLISVIANVVIAELYRYPREAYLYIAVLSWGIILISFTLSVVKEYQKSKKRLEIISQCKSGNFELTYPECLLEEDYNNIIETLKGQLSTVVSEYDEKTTDMQDYYSMWVHQIKTPIAAMKLMLGSEDSELSRKLNIELFRTEQYVDMVLQYIRLSSDNNDLVIREHKLNELITEVIRKYASQFIIKRLKLDYVETNKTIVTDQKWFAFILEQILSNALKYTLDGTISISVIDYKLYISDTGIGIDKSDLPRIFEKGYTGSNGRIGQKSSGIGLYLCKKAAEKLAITVEVESEVSKGTTFVLSNLKS